MKRSVFVAAALAAVLLTGCGKSRRDVNMVIIGLDGWGAYAMDSVAMPTVRSMMEGGVYTLEKRSVFPSASAANWAAMFMGVPPETSGYTRWNTKTPEVPSRVVNSHGIFPTFFSIAREQRPGFKIGCMYEWEGIKWVVDTLAFDHHIKAPMNPEETTGMVCEYIKNEKPDIFYVHYDEPDYTGHHQGHNTPEYFAECELMDSLIARIVDAVREAGLYDNTVFVLTADHGGVKKGHGKASVMEMYTPLVIFGKGIPAKGEYKGWVAQYDVAPTLAAVYGFKTPAEWLGKRKML